MTRVLVVADHPLAVRNIRLSLRQTTGFETIGLDGVGAANGGIRAALAQTRPDVVLIDDMHDQDDTLQRVREVAEGAPEAKTLLLTRHSDSRWLDQAFEAGAEVVLSKSINPLAVGTLLREVVAGRVVHRPRRTAQRISESDCPLTSRELEILRLAAQGYTNSRIAGELWVTEQTVKFHLSNTYRKLGVANRTEASRYAYVNDLVQPQLQLAS
jgi:DNA-binding NarL/FixJ family response regulator